MRIIATLGVNYVAEYHENLQHVLVFLTASGMTAGVNLEAEVVPASQVPQSSDLYGYLHLKCGLSTSSFLRLPARVAPGKKDVKVDGQHFQIKLAASPSTATSVPSPLLDATRLMQDRPTSYICASCSLPLVHCSRMQDYRDLPSEHWAELVDAWMCHSDQKLHEHVTRHSNEGFWPTPEYALVGGSYLLFEQSVVMKQHLWPEEEYPERKVSRLPSVHFHITAGHREGRRWIFTNGCLRRVLACIVCVRPKPLQVLVVELGVMLACEAAAGRCPSVDTKRPKEKACVHAQSLAKQLSSY